MARPTAMAQDRPLPRPQTRPHLALTWAPRLTPTARTTGKGTQRLGRRGRAILQALGRGPPCRSSWRITRQKAAALKDWEQKHLNFKKHGDLPYGQYAWSDLASTASAGATVPQQQAPASLADSIAKLREKQTEMKTALASLPADEKDLGKEMMFPCQWGILARILARSSTISGRISPRRKRRR